MNFKNRLQKLRQRFTEKEVDAILISQQENRQYLSGFDGSAGYLLISLKKAVLATDFRYTEQAARQSPDYEVFRITGDTSAWFPRMIDILSGTRLGFESGSMTFAEHAQLSGILEKGQSRIKFVPVDGLVESLRTVKDAEEIELITRAATISDAALNFIEGRLCDGITELEIGWEIEKFMREAGSMPVPFDVIVASGPNAALPHAKPSERVIQPGEPVIVQVALPVAEPQSGAIAYQSSP